MYVESRNARFYSIKTKVASPKGWVIHFHGNGGRACDRYGLVNDFLKMGYHLALAEYPGYAQEADLPGQEELLSSAMGVYDAVEKMDPDLPIVLYGESLGAAVATWLASEKDSAKALILQSPFPSIKRVAKHHYPYLPAALLLHTFPADQWAQKTDTKTKAKVFVFHGDQDDIIPMEMGKEQFENFPSERKTFWEVRGAGHNDIGFVAGGELWSKLGKFLSPEPFIE